MCRLQVSFLHTERGFLHFPPTTEKCTPFLPRAIAYVGQVFLSCHNKYRILHNISINLFGTKIKTIQLTFATIFFDTREEVHFDQFWSRCIVLMMNPLSCRQLRHTMSNSL